VELVREKKEESQAERMPPEEPIASTVEKERREEGRKVTALEDKVEESFVSCSARRQGLASAISAFTTVHFRGSPRPQIFHDSTIKETKFIEAEKTPRRKPKGEQDFSD
jgi:hypothetical protein